MKGLKRFKDNYDVIVVGGGFGGLTAALRLAQKGVDVLLVEQHNMTGGFATSFVRGRFEFEATLHALCEFGTGQIEAKEKGIQTAHGRARRLLIEECGVDLDLKQTPEMYRCILSNYDINMTMPYGRTKIVEAIEKLSPGDGEKMSRYLDLCEEIADALEDIENSSSIKPLKILKDHASFVRLAGYSVAEVNAQFNFSERTIQVLHCMVGYLGHSMRIISFPVWAVMLHRYLIEGAHIPEKTSHSMANKVEMQLRKLGAQVECCTKVERFLTESDRVTGIELADGTRIGARQVICNALATIAITKMLPESFIPERMKKLYNVRKLALSPFTMYLGLNAPAKEMGIDSYEYFIGDHLHTEQIAETIRHWVKHPKLVVTCSDVAIPGCTGKNRCQLNFAETYHPDAFLEAMDKYKYLESNEELANYLIDRFELATGASIREHIEEISISTPATYVRYANALRGNIYGYEQTALDGVISRTLSMEKERFLKGLDFVGGGTFRTVGYSSVISSGIRVAEDTFKELQGVS